MRVDDGLAEKPAFSPDKVQIIGLSADSVQKQKNFVEKHQLPVCVLFNSESFY